MIPANHENMTKFSSPYDIGFIRIVATLTRWLDDIKSKSSINSVDSQHIGEVCSHCHLFSGNGANIGVVVHK